MTMRLSDSIAKNPGWKLLSLALGTSIWLTIHFTIQGNPKLPRNPVITVSTLTLRVPIAVMTAASGARLFRVVPDAVDVTIGGNEAALEKVKESDIRVFIDLFDVVDARSLRKKVLVHPPAGVNLVKVVPTDVTVEPLLSVDSAKHPKKD